MVFDGSDVGVTVDLNGFARLADGDILMTFNASAAIPGVGTVDDSDIVRFTPTQLGASTSGVFSLYFDGSDVGLTTNGEDIDALHVAPDGTLIISTIGSHSVPGVSGADEDLLSFAVSTLGATTSGSWARYFDGSDVALNSSGSEDVYGVWEAANGDIYLSTRGTFGVAGLSGTGSDIFTCVNPVTSSATSCADFTLYFDGSAEGVGSEILDGFYIGP